MKLLFEGGWAFRLSLGGNGAWPPVPGGDIRMPACASRLDRAIACPVSQMFVDLLGFWTFRSNLQNV